MKLLCIQTTHLFRVNSTNLTSESFCFTMTVRQPSIFSTMTIPSSLRVNFTINKLVLFKAAAAGATAVVLRQLSHCQSRLGCQSKGVGGANYAKWRRTNRYSLLAAVTCSGVASIGPSRAMARPFNQSINQSCIFRVVQVTKSLQDPLEVGNNLLEISDNVRK